MRNYHNIAKNITKSPLQMILIAVLVVFGNLGFVKLMEKGLLHSPFSIIVFLFALIMIFTIAFYFAYIYLCKKKIETLTKNDIRFYVRVNYLIAAIAIVVFGTVLLLT